MQGLVRVISLILFILSVQFIRSQALTTSLTACYALDGNGVEPYSNLTGTLSSATATVDRFNNPNSALYFSGSSSSYVELPDDPLIKSPYISFSAWVKPTVLTNAYIVFTSNTSTSNIDAYSLKTLSVSAGYVFEVVKTNGSTTHSVQSTTTITANTWYFVGFTMFNGAIRVYVNGTEVSVGSNMNIDYNSGKKVILGGTNETYNLPFTGIIDNIKFHNRQILPTEEMSLYTNDFTCIPTPAPTCTNVLYSINTTSSIVHVSNTGSVNTSSVSTLQLPLNAKGLAIAPSFSFNAPNPTYWTTVAGTLWYYNGRGFYSTGHNAGSSVDAHIGGSLNYLYSYNTSGPSVYRYNGTGNATFVASYNSALNVNYVSQDIAADDKDNFYLLKLDNPPSLNVYNSSGAQICTYSVSGLPNITSGFGFAIINNTIVVNAAWNYWAEINGPVITFTQINQSFPTPHDFASCMAPVSSFSSSIAASPNTSVSCFNPTISLTVTSPVSSASYTWSGPGIVGSTHNAIVTVTVGGVYTCSLMSCAGGTSAATFTVLNDPYQLIPTAGVTNSINCYSPYAQLDVSPNTSTNTILWSGPGIFGVNTTPTITIISGGIYTVSVSNTLNACAGTATIAAFGSTAPLNLSLTASGTMVCQPAPSITLTASGADTFSWTPVSSTNSVITVNPVSSTTYTVYGNTGACTGSAAVTVSANVTPTLINASGNPTVCSGSPTTLSLSGAADYTWQPGNLNGASILITPTSTVVYSITGANGFCSVTTTISVNTLTTPVVLAGASPTAICEGSFSSLSASGAVSYTWQPLNSTLSSLTVSPLSTIVYSVSGTNVLGCSKTETVLVIVNPNPTITISPSSASVCSGSSATLTGSGANTYIWLPASITTSTLLVTPLTLTTYTLSGSSNNCPGSQTISVGVNMNPVVSASLSSSTVCSGNTVTLSATGALTYTWFPVNIAGQIINTNPVSNINYTVTGADVNGCINTAIVPVNVNANPTLSISSSSLTICSGSSASLNVSGANNYTWMPGNLTATSVVLNPASTTVYSITGTNTLGCSVTNTIGLTIVPTPTLSAVVSPSIICAGDQATLSATGATNYTWNPPAIFSGSAVVIPAGSATYSVSGANGACVTTLTTAVVVNANPAVFVSNLPGSICSGASNTLSAFGANSYTWFPGGLTGATVVVSPLTTTVYSVSGMYSSTGCTTTVLAPVSVTTTPTLTVSPFNPTICAAALFTLNATGATNYSWIPGNLGGSSVTVSPTSSTIYTVIGANGVCTASGTLALSVNPTPILTASSSTAHLCSGNSATLSSTGALNYTWSPVGAYGASISVTPSTTVTYTVFGDNSFGCVSTNTVLLGVSSTPTLYISATPSAVCPGATVSLDGGGASSYFWQNIGAGSNATVAPLTSTIYVLSGTIGLCTATKTVAVVVYPTPLVQANASPTAVCPGNTLTLMATGAANYTWNPGALTGSNVVISPASSSVYTITGISSDGCYNTAITTVILNPVPSLMISNSPGSICSGNTVTFVANGATNYTWYPGGSTTLSYSVSPLTTSAYTLQGTNIYGCLGASVTSLTVIPTPTLLPMISTSVICAGNTTSLSSTGASNYTWNPGAISNSLISVSPTASTIYTLTGANGNCIDSKTMSVVVNPVPTLSINGGSLICAGNSETLSASGATNYTWMPGGMTTTLVNVNPLATIIYTVTGTFSTGCSSLSITTLSVVMQPTVIVAISSSVLCLGSTSTLTASGATAYSWTPGNFNSPSLTVSPLSNIVYTLTGTIGSCSDNKTVAITVNPLPTINVTGTTNTLCVAETVTLSATGASLYIWSNGMTDATIAVTPTITTSYTVTGTDTNGCENTAFAAQLVDACTGIKKIPYADKLTLLFPNPNNGKFKVVLNFVSDRTRLLIYNSLGQLIESRGNVQSDNSFDLTHYSNGIYVLKVWDGDRLISVSKVIKQ